MSATVELAVMFPLDDRAGTYFAVPAMGTVTLEKAHVLAVPTLVTFGILKAVPNVGNVPAENVTF